MPRPPVRLLLERDHAAVLLVGYEGRLEHLAQELPWQCIRLQKKIDNLLVRTSREAPQNQSLDHGAADRYLQQGRVRHLLRGTVPGVRELGVPVIIFFPPAFEAAYLLQVHSI